MCFLRRIPIPKSTVESIRFPQITPLSKLLYQFKLTSSLATGSSGNIYTARKRECGTVMALKVCPHNQLREALAYVALQDSLPHPEGIPRIFGYGYSQSNHQTFLALELLGLSLADIMYTHTNIPLKSVCMVAIRVLKTLEYVHSKHIIHGDINPGNIVLGKQDPNKIYLIDFENAKRYRDHQGNHIPQTFDHINQANSCYASTFSHDGYEISRRDDLISLAYALVRLAKGSLPWEKNCAELLDRIHVVSIKKTISREALCRDLPLQFKIFVKRVQELSFCEDPEYDGFIWLFNNCLEELGEVDDGEFCWVEEPGSSK